MGTNTESRMSLGAVARELDVNIATSWRWALRGVRGRKLKTFLIGGRRYVWREDLNEFLAGGNDMESVPSDRLRRAADAGRILDGAGAKPALHCN